MTIYKSNNDYPKHLRLIRFYDQEQSREFLFLTNAMELTALQIADQPENTVSADEVINLYRRLDADGKARVREHWAKEEN